VKSPGPRRLTLLPLIAACFFIVSGGPYGLEELVAKSGYDRTLWILILTPLVWSLPTAFAVVEMAAALPERGGYYAWVRRALGPFWGFQEAWLSLAASFFDMAIYPTLFLLYLKQVVPMAGSPVVSVTIGIAFIAAGALLNIAGTRAVGGSSLLFALAILGPFAVFVGMAGIHPAVASRPFIPGGLMAGVLVAMWNYMGWDNACNFANEVDHPQRTYPRAIFATVALVTVAYLLPVLAAQRAGLDPSGWTAGSWATAASAIAGPWLGAAVVAGGMICAFGMYNSLVLSYSRLPVAMAEDGFLPAIFTKATRRTGAPWVSIGVCALIYAACLGLGFDGLLQLDILLYGLSLALEFIALVALRLREPALERPFRVPGGLTGAIAVGVPPTLLLCFALAYSFRDPEATSAGLWLALVLIVMGPILYAFASAAGGTAATSNR
jgi:amino acid transporter